jgi:hypothetical protein
MWSDHTKSARPTISGPTYQLRGVHGSPAYPPPQHVSPTRYASSSRPSSPRPVALWSRALPSRCCALKTLVPRPGRREAFLLFLPSRRRFRRRSYSRVAPVLASLLSLASCFRGCFGSLAPPLAVDGRGDRRRRTAGTNYSTHGPSSRSSLNSCRVL